LRVGERGIARPEVVDGDPHAERLDRFEALRRVLDMAHQLRLGDLEGERIRLQPAVGEGFRDVGDDLVVVELTPRDVDSDLDAVTGGAPLRGLMGGLFDDPSANLSDQSHLLEQRDEVVRLHNPPSGVVPAQERLDAGRLHVAQVQRGLVDETELVVGQRLVEVELQFHAGLHRVLHPVSEAAMDTFPRRRKPQTAGDRPPLA